jgi:hypothetical protein
MSAEYDDYRRRKLESGAAFQDFVVAELFQRRGIVLSQFASRRYQLQHGETIQGIEIKHDERCAASGHLWIEVAERATDESPEYVPSGIMRVDNSWLYVIGDRTVIYALSKTWLRRCHQSGKYEIRENNLKTSKGFLLPCAVADQAADFVERFAPPGELTSRDINFRGARP